MIISMLLYPANRFTLQLPTACRVSLSTRAVEIVLNEL